jgi:hypothetical protein
MASSRRIQGRLFGLCVAAALSGFGCSGDPAASSAAQPPVQTKPEPPQQPGAPKPDPVTTAAPKGGEPVNSDARAMAAFEARLDAYVALHRTLEEKLPKLEKDATPEQIDRHQRALAQLVHDARRDAKPGDLFTPETRVVVRALMARVFAGPDGKALRDSIMDENPRAIKVTVNSRYPDTVPLSTVPPQVLQGLPKLPNEMEYRFVGNHLILMDVHAHLIADVVENALPR